MSHFTSAEIEYLKSQRLGRLATVNSKGEPHVVPVSFRYNAASKKYRDADCRGSAQVSTTGGKEIGPGFDPEIIRVYPVRIIGWGIDSDAYDPQSRTVK